MNIISGGTSPLGAGVVGFSLDVGDCVMSVVRHSDGGRLEHKTGNEEDGHDDERDGEPVTRWRIIVIQQAETAKVVNYIFLVLHANIIPTSPFRCQPATLSLLEWYEVGEKYSHLVTFADGW